jgi:SAM-dependent methyltransferase
MIFHKLIFRYLRYRDDEEFYRMQAQDTVRWLERKSVKLDGATALDLGCGHGILGGELARKGSRVTFADERRYLLPEFDDVDFRIIDIEKDDLGTLGTFDLVIYSNVLEHIPDPAGTIDSLVRTLSPGGRLYLSWTNWLSPWGGHEFSPFHYLGPSRGHLVYDRFFKRPRLHTPYQNLFPTSISSILKLVRANQSLNILSVVPRYYTELAFITSVPVLREFLAWNCVVLAERKTQ